MTDLVNALPYFVCHDKAFIRQTERHSITALVENKFSNKIWMSLIVVP